MNRLLTFLILLISLAGCNQRPALDLPLTDFPEFARVENWGCYGSCAWAGLASNLELNGFYSDASEVRRTCRGGASWPELEHELDNLGLPYQSTRSGDFGFVRRACEAGRTCVVGLWTGGNCVPYAPRSTSRRPYGHAVVAFYCDTTTVGLYDSNHCMYRDSPIRFVSVRNFLADWQGWAITAYAD
jgi:hypothetical protein